MMSRIKTIANFPIEEIMLSREEGINILPEEATGINLKTISFTAEK